MNHDDIIENLAQRGWAVQAGFFPQALTDALLADLTCMQEAGRMKQAAIGRAGDVVQDERVRTDTTLWLTGEVGAQADFLGMMDVLRQEVNRALYLGLVEFEAHYALYQAGGFYKKHLDSFRGKKNRILSTVSYLTPDWTESDAGHLILYAPEDESREIARILPRAGTLAVFMSEEVPHEVLPPARARCSIAGWFRAREGV